MPSVVKLCSIKVYNKSPLCQIDVGATTVRKYLQSHNIWQAMSKENNYSDLTRLDVISSEIGSVKEQEEISWIKKAQRYIRQHQYTDAINILDRIIYECSDIDSIYSNALFRKAECFSLLSKWQEALGCLNQVYTLDPKRKYIWGSRAACLLGMGQHKKALEYCKKGLMLDNSEYVCFVIKADCLVYFKKYEEAIKYYDKSLAIKSSEDSVRNKTYCLIKLGKFEEACNLVDTVLILTPLCIISLNYKAECLLQLKKYEEALEYYDKRLFLSSSIAALKNKAFCLCVTGKYEEALKCCDEITELDPNYKSDAILDCRIFALCGLKRYDEAIHCHNAKRIININDRNSLSIKALSLQKFGKHKEAIKFLENILKSDPANKQIKLSLVLSKTIYLTSEGKIDEALIAIDNVLEFMPDTNVVMIFKAYILNIIGKYVEAIKYCDNVINKDPNFIEAWEIKAKACFYLGDEEESKNIHNIIKSKYDSKLELSK